MSGMSSLDDEIDWDKFKSEEGSPIGDVCLETRDEKHISTYTGDYFEICIVGDEGEKIRAMTYT